MADEPLKSEWAAELYVKEQSLAFRATWELYMKFYTVFLTVNFAALAATIQYITNNNRRWPIIAAFVLQNVLVGLTSVGMGRYSGKFIQRFQQILGAIAEEAGPQLAKLRGEAVPVWLGRWGGYSNAAGCGLLAICWIASYWV